MNTVEEIIAREEEIMVHGEHSDPNTLGGPDRSERSEAGQGDPPVGRKIFPAKAITLRVPRYDSDLFTVDPTELRSPTILRDSIADVLQTARYRASMARALSLAAQEFGDAEA